MSSLDGTGLPPVIGGAQLPANPTVSAPEAPNKTSALGVASFVPGVGNSSGLLQNFILPKTTLDSLGLLKPSNQGDSEVLVSQAALTAEQLADDNDSVEASAQRWSAAAQASIFAVLGDRIKALTSENTQAREAIESKNAELGPIGTEIDQKSDALSELEDQKLGASAEIAELKNETPQTDQTAEQIAELEQEIVSLNAQIDQLNDESTALRESQNALISEIEGLRDEISQKSETIAAHQNVIKVISSALDRLLAQREGAKNTVESTQEQAATETGEVLLEEILPKLQKIFEIDLEDAGIEKVISETRLNDRETDEAVAVSFGLVGSFYESLGVFLQRSNLVELDLNSTAFGNNKSQRMQISV